MKPLRFLVAWVFLACLPALASGAGDVPQVITNGLAKAKSEGKLLLVDFYAGWCPPCREMDKLLHEENMWDAITKNYHYVKLDVGRLTRAGVEHYQDELKYYRVSSVPHFLVFTPDGQMIGQRIGYHNIQMMDETIVFQKAKEAKEFETFLAAGILGRQLSSVNEPQTILYLAVKDRHPEEENGTDTSVVRRIRIESGSNGRPPTWLVSEKDRPFKNWLDDIKAARDPGAVRPQELLRKQFPGDPKNDSGKTILFQDLTGASVTPGIAGFPDASIVTGSVADALKRRKDLVIIGRDVPEFTGFVAYPAEEDDLKVMFRKKSPDLWKQWQDATKELLLRAGKVGIKFFDPNAMRGFASKDAFFDELVKAHNIIFIACHADKAVITFPGQKPIEVAPADIAKLNLVNKPFVFLRVCESSAGDNAKFAQAFLKAGARGVCVNTNIIEPSETNRHVFSFLAGLQRTKSIEMALQSMDVKQKVMSALYTLKRWLRRDVA